MMFFNTPALKLAQAKVLSSSLSLSSSLTLVVSLYKWMYTCIHMNVYTPYSRIMSRALPLDTRCGARNLGLCFQGHRWRRSKPSEYSRCSVPRKTLNWVQHSYIENGSSRGLNLALTALCVPSSRRGARHLGHCLQGLRWGRCNTSCTSQEPSPDSSLPPERTSHGVGCRVWDVGWTKRCCVISQSRCVPVTFLLRHYVRKIRRRMPTHVTYIIHYVHYRCNIYHILCILHIDFLLNPPSAGTASTLPSQHQAAAGLVCIVHIKYTSDTSPHAYICNIY